MSWMISSGDSIIYSHKQRTTLDHSIICQIFCPLVWGKFCGRDYYFPTNGGGGGGGGFLENRSRG